MAVYLLVVLERDKQLSVVPIISVLSFSLSGKGSNVDSAFCSSVDHPLRHRVCLNLGHVSVRSGYQNR